MRGVCGNDFLIDALRTINRDDHDRLESLLLALGFTPDERQQIFRLNPSQRHFFRRFVCDALNDDRPLILYEALSNLRLLRVRSVLDRILAFKQHPHHLAREGVLRYVQALYPKLALPLLIEALQDDSHWVRENAAELLGSLGDPAAIPYLEPLLNDADEYVREEVKGTLECLRDDEK